MIHEMKTGSYTGSGAAQTVTLGFKPKVLFLINITDGDVLSVFTDTMTAGTNISVDTEVALESSNGVTLTAAGFSLGTGTTVNENAKVFHYVAIGNAGLTAAGA